MYNINVETADSLELGEPHNKDKPEDKDGLERIPDFLEQLQERLCSCVRYWNAVKRRIYHSQL